jgi:hypothetical protein
MQLLAELRRALAGFFPESALWIILYKRATYGIKGVVEYYLTVTLISNNVPST